MADKVKVAVVTGASSGIGKATALMLAQAGWRVIGVGRDPERSAAAEAALRTAAPDATIDFLRADFDEMKDVVRVAGEIAGLTDRIHVLINNAGGVRDQLYVTSEGLEATFAANHLAPFVLTRELLPILEATAAEEAPGTVRILATSSLAHESSPGMHWADLNMLDDYKTGPAYCQAKLANILFTRELQRRVEGSGIIAHSMHPGVIASNFANHGDANMKAYMTAKAVTPPEEPARTLVWMATAPENGRDGARYFYDMAESPTGAQAQDDDAAKRLWNESEAMLARIGV